MGPTQIAIFGASGDLTRRKLLPALLGNLAEGALPQQLQVIGISRSKRTDEAWRTELDAIIPAELQSAWQALRPRVHWCSVDAAVPADVARLHARLDDLTAELGSTPDTTGRLFYLALMPKLFGPVVEALDTEGFFAGDPDTGAWRRVVVEKPFGKDLASARTLNRKLLTHLREDQLFRIDHYLGKETVQNILAFRFQNAIFEPLWNRNHIESVEISVCETVAMEGNRGAYYDTAGAIRDMVQNHLLQVLALVAMEAPGSMDADAVRNEKVKVLQALRPFSPERAARDTVRAQYTAGPARDVGFLDAPGVAPDSTTETYVALRAHVDNWRWSGVPFLLRTGKALPKRFSEVILRFRAPPVDLLTGPVSADACALRPNALHLLIQPDEAVRLSFLVKQPGPGMVMRPSVLGFDYAAIGDGTTPPAYQRLLLDALEGNATLFIRGDEVEAAWSFVDGIRAGWETANATVHTYPAGSWGPDAAHALFHGCEGTWTEGP